MKQQLIRPDKKSVRKVTKEMASLYKSLRTITDSEVKIKREISGKAPGLRKASARNELVMMDVDILNADKSGIRVSALKKAGIINVGQLCNVPVNKLMQIKGIGADSAGKIKKITDKLYNTVMNTAKIRINLQNKTRSQNIVVENLFVLRNSEAQRAQGKELLSKESSLKKLLSTAKPAAGVIRWFFMTQAMKERSVQAYRQLSILAEGSFPKQARQCIDEYNSVAAKKKADAYSDYERNSVSYFTLLEGMGHGAADHSTTSLSADLVSVIEQYPLNPVHMKSTLRHYQVFGAKYMLTQKKALLGDEMGLGKTIQALAVIADLKSRGMTHFLVVCPASVLVNWHRETGKHTDISSMIIHGNKREYSFEQWRNEGGVGITNYESLITLADKIDFTYGSLVVDEAHFVKNPEANRTKALSVAALKANSIFFMTGTPLENRVEEMCFLVNCLRPDIAKRISTMKTLSTTEAFKKEISPVYLRRVRNDVLTELPDLIESEEWVEPTPSELEMYRMSVMSGNFMAMRRVSWHDNVLESGKSGRLVELCDEARDEGCKVIAFSFFRDTLSKVCDLLGDRAIGPITGDVSTVKRQEMIDEFTEAEDGKVLVAQVQAGGVGLNIQSANVVIFCEPQIKPSLEAQAVSRAYRMGQVRNVHVHRLLCTDTIDEHMIKMLARKQAEFDAYADESMIGKESLQDQSEKAWIKEVIEQEQLRQGIQSSELR
jgi:SNF2 family DNA or RNA helicase